MKKFTYLFLAAVMIFSACEKEVIPTPVPAQKNLIVFSEDVDSEYMLFKEDPVSGDTYIEVWFQEDIPGHTDDFSYIPYFQRLGKDGKLKWNQWLPITRKAGLLWVNETVFDITTDGCVVNGFNSVDEDGRCQVFMTKINPDGTFAWGNEGKLLYDFGDKALFEVPCESFVVADNEGGAWIAAGNGQETLIFARVDSDGNFIVEPIVFSSKNGTDEDRDMVRRPQMFVGSDNSLIALIQYGNAIGGGGSSPIMIEGYYDIVKIPADGNAGNIKQNHLMDGIGMFNPGLKALLTEDGKGGAYVNLVDGVEDIHAYLYHFDSEANVNVRGVDLYPSGSNGALNLYAALDSKTNNLVVLLQDDVVDDYRRPYSVVNLNVADLNGNLKYESDGKTVFASDPLDNVLDNMGYFIPAPDGRFIFSFILSMNKKSSSFYQSRIDIDKGEIQNIEEMFEIDAPLVFGFDRESRMQLTDGFLRHLWLAPNDKSIYGYDLKIK